MTQPVNPPPGPVGPAGEPRHAPEAWHGLMNALGRHLPRRLHQANQHAGNIAGIVSKHAGRH